MKDNLHDDLCLTDPPVIIFDGESQLNALLYGSDEFNDKINKEILLRIIPNRADDTGVVERGMYSNFLFSKKKREAKGKTNEFQRRNY